MAKCERLGNARNDCDTGYMVPIARDRVFRLKRVALTTGESLSIDLDRPYNRAATRPPSPTCPVNIATVIKSLHVL